MMLVAAADPATGVLTMVASLACFVVAGVLALLHMEGINPFDNWSNPKYEYCPICKSRLDKKGNCRRCGYQEHPIDPADAALPPPLPRQENYPSLPPRLKGKPPRA